MRPGLRLAFRRALLGAALLLPAALPVLAQDAKPPGPLRVYAAGSLTGAFNALLQAFGAPPGEASQPTYGPSGVLRERLERGEAADLFASADMGQPRRLAAAGRGTPVVMFARNRMCALGRAGLGMTPANLLYRLLDPAIKLATSTPLADPGGDYAWAVFARAEQVHPGAKAILEGKAQQLVGGPSMAPLVPGVGPSEGVFLSGRADVMLGYCSGAAGLQRTLPDLAAMPLPPELEVGPEYGLTVLSGSPAAARFALFVLSEPGQAILARHGLVPVALPAGQAAARP
ncbi:MAG TPA: extracellular solute-binding protein [Acetobacteraceae bacterium]